MTARNLATNAQTMPPSRLRPDVPEERGKNVPALDEIYQRAIEIHVERADHLCDLDEFLEEWLHGCRRKASSGKSTTGPRMRERKRNELDRHSLVRDGHGFVD
jgi:hypothetical protein